MKLDMKAIRARADAATPGEWLPRCDYDTSDGCLRWLCNDKDYADIIGAGAGGPVASFEVRRTDAERDSWTTKPVDRQRVEANIVFIAAARSDVPALCDRIEALEAALREIEAGKTAQDIDHPLGEGFSMAARFRRIARAALEGEP